MAGYRKEWLISSALCIKAIHTTIKPSPGGHTVICMVFLCFCTFPEMRWVPISPSVHYCVRFLLPGPTYRLVKSEVMQQPGHLNKLRVNGGVKNGKGLIVSSHWYAKHCSITIRTLVGFDQNLLYLYPPPPWSVRAFFSMSLLPTAPVTETNRKSPAVTKPALAWHLESQYTLSTLMYCMRPTLSDMFFWSNPVFKGTLRPILSKHFTCRVAGQGLKLVVVLNQCNEAIYLSWTLNNKKIIHISSWAQ